MQAVPHNNVEKAMQILCGFDLYSQGDQIALMAVVTALRVRRKEHIEGVLRVCTLLYGVYFSDRLGKIGIKTSDSSEYALALMTQIASQDVVEAREMLKDLLSDKPVEATKSASLCKMLGTPSFNREWLRS